MLLLIDKFRSRRYWEWNLLEVAATGFMNLKGVVTQIHQYSRSSLPLIISYVGLTVRSIGFGSRNKN